MSKRSVLLKPNRREAAELTAKDTVSINPYPEHSPKPTNVAASLGFYGSAEEITTVLRHLKGR